MLDIQESFNMIVQTVIGGALSIACIYVSIFISKSIEVAKSKASALKHEEAQNIIMNALNRTDDLITTNIIAAEQTLKPQILIAIKDGEVDKSELQGLSITVKENVLKQLSTDMYEVLNAALLDTNSYLENRIEKILAELKDAEGNVVSHTAI